MWDSTIGGEEAYPNTAYFATDNEWMTKTAFLSYDGHASHIGVASIESALANDVVILKLLSRTSHILQSLNVARHRQHLEAPLNESVQNNELFTAETVLTLITDETNQPLTAAETAHTSPKPSSSAPKLGQNDESPGKTFSNKKHQYSDNEGEDELIEKQLATMSSGESETEEFNEDFIKMKIPNEEDMYERAILAATNKDVNDLNIKIQSQINGQIHSFKSIDSIIDPNEVVNYPTEFLNSLDLPGLPPHYLQLKVGLVIIMLRNLNQPKLCNGTRLAVKEIMNNLIEATIIIGKFKGEDVLIPRIPLMPTDFAIQFKRVQFPVRLAFAMSINKSQGQSLEIRTYSILRTQENLIMENGRAVLYSNSDKNEWTSLTPRGIHLVEIEDTKSLRASINSPTFKYFIGMVLRTSFELFKRVDAIDHFNLVVFRRPVLVSIIKTKKAGGTGNGPESTQDYVEKLSIDVVGKHIAYLLCEVLGVSNQGLCGMVTVGEICFRRCIPKNRQQLKQQAATGEPAESPNKEYKWEEYVSQEPENSYELDGTISEEEIVLAASQLGTNKTIGTDAIPAEIVQVMANTQSHYLSQLLHIQMANNIFPIKWKDLRLHLIEEPVKQAHPVWKDKESKLNLARGDSASARGKAQSTPWKK
ncbi:hypothetical protein ILUMI_03031 [Ignelater luminosus]|uniref:DNA helicase Pif1-like 2B domain-containing protein n=1 Tax=Ignelater luminosus TaxID=2038154 RepID=A0A8K0DFC5_IGNLU|nr:hypothetical protein ILUMI_03031 [Ignelater luminosus]